MVLEQNIAEAMIRYRFLQVKLWLECDLSDEIIIQTGICGSFFVEDLIEMIHYFRIINNNPKRKAP